jgi:hypothetical protein
MKSPAAEGTAGDEVPRKEQQAMKSPAAEGTAGDEVPRKEQQAMKSPAEEGTAGDRVVPILLLFVFIIFLTSISLFCNIKKQIRILKSAEKENLKQKPGKKSIK